MNFAISKNLSSFLGKLFLYLLILYVFVILGKAIWGNYQLKKQTEKIRSDISRIEKQNQNLRNLIVYYQSPSFREVQARQKLGLKKPDEVVVNVAPKKTNDFQDEITQEQQNITAPEKNKTVSNPELWWEYFLK